MFRNLQQGHGSISAPQYRCCLHYQAACFARGPASVMCTARSQLGHSSASRAHNCVSETSVSETTGPSPCPTKLPYLRVLGLVPAALQTVGGVLLAVIVASLWPLDSAAETVRVEDVENPALQAGLEAANERRFADAERFFQIVLKEDSNSASAWSNIGNVHLSRGRPIEALSDFSHAIELAPDAPVPYLNRALAKEQLGVDAEGAGSRAQAADFYKDAIHDCEKAVQLDPKEFAAWFNRGNVEARLLLYADALNSYRKAADLAPGIIGYRLREAELMYQLDGQQQDASRMMRTVARKNPSYAEAHAALAAAEWQAGHRQLAEEHFATASMIDFRWSDPLSYIRSSMRWPPRLYAAMESFLAMSVS